MLSVFSGLINMRNFSTGCLLTLLLLLLWPALAYSQQTITEEMKKQAMAESFGIEVDGPQMKRLMAGQIAWGPSGEDRPVIKHVRGNYGIPIPSKEMMWKAFEWTPERKEKLEKLIYANALRLEKKLMDSPELKACENSITRRNKMAVPEKKAVPTSKFDLLILDPEDMPSEPDEAFGLETQVKPYSTALEDGMTLLAGSYNVRCLPTRLRATGTYVFWHEGLDALKNFDKDLHGSGTLHPLMTHKEKEYR